MMLHGKFNSILEERLLDGHPDHHRIMSIVVPQNEFNAWGDMSSVGEETFWNEVNRGMMKFDTNAIMLNPRNFKKGETSMVNRTKNHPSKVHSWSERFKNIRLMKRDSS